MPLLSAFINPKFSKPLQIGPAEKMSPEPWKRNFIIIFIAELIVIMGFSFVIPFLPLYIQQVGSLNSEDAAFWAGIAGSAAGIAMFISAPIWGVLADRWGRKPMVLRAMFGGGIVIALTGLVHNVYAIVALRFLMGLLSGTVAAASALVASDTPREKLPYIMGLLMVAVNGGTAFGPLFGGFIAEKTGYTATFLITGAVLFLGGIIVMLFVTEKFTPPPKEETASLSKMFQLAKSKELLPILGITLALNAGPAIISPVLSLYISELNPAGSAETASGTAFFLMGVVATISALIAGRLGQRINLKTIIIFSCIGTGMLYLPPMLAVSATQILVFMAMTGLFRGGMITSSSALVGLVTLPAQQGIAYGINQSAASLGSAIGPFIGGTFAPLIGLKNIFAVTAGVHVLTGIMVWKLLASVNINKSNKISDSSQ
ncbi:MAG: MFS transporter [Dehalococcoidales bacterium]|nr:MFS transporter [Dehalococcoidales bacterium]